MIIDRFLISIKGNQAVDHHADKWQLSFRSIKGLEKDGIFPLLLSVGEFFNLSE